MLSAAQFADLIAQIQMVYDDGTKSEVRRSPRVDHPCRITITIGVKPDVGPSFLVQMKDISTRGMSFLHNAELSRDTRFIVTLQPPDGTNVMILTKVVHCRQIDEHTWQIGAEFISPANQTEPLKIAQSFEDLIHIRTPLPH